MSGGFRLILFLIFFAASTTRAFDFDALSALISNKNILSIEDLLKELPEEMKSNSVLMHKSLSLHEASYENPRAILFNKDASLLLTFNGSPSQYGFHQLELIAFRPETNRFEFREIKFPTQPNNKLRLSSQVHISKANPPVCMGCHGGLDPRPNWEPYNQWPGAYGSMAAGISVDRSPEAALQLEPFKRFLKESHSHARYQHVKNLTDIIIPEIDFYHLENLSTLTQKLSQLNLRRVVRIMKSAPFFEEYKLALIATLYCEHEVARYIPAPLFQKHIELTRPIKEVTSAIEGRSNSLIEQLNLVFEPQGLSTTHWSMDFGTGGKQSATHRFHTPNSDSEHILLGLLLKDEPAIRALIDAYSPHKTCKTLQEKSHSTLNDAVEKNQLLSKLSGLSVQEKNKRIPKIDLLLSSKVKPPRLLLQCASCHASGSTSVPEIPFDDLTLLKNEFVHNSLLHEIRYRLAPSTPASEQMPPQLHGLESDKTDLLRFFESL